MFKKFTSYSDETFEMFDCTESELSNISFDNCHFKNCNFTKTHLLQCKFEDCTFTECLLANCIISNTKLSDSIFKTCKLSGLNFSYFSQLLFSISAEGSHFESCVFLNQSLQKTQIINCECRHCDFEQVDFTSAKFEGTDFSGSTFNHCNLQKADFREALNYTLNPSENNVKGALFSNPEVLSLLTPFKIKISH